MTYNLLVDNLKKISGLDIAHHFEKGENVFEFFNGGHCVKTCFTYAKAKLFAEGIQFGVNLVKLEKHMKIDWIYVGYGIWKCSNDDLYKIYVTDDGNFTAYYNNVSVARCATLQAAKECCELHDGKVSRDELFTLLKKASDKNPNIDAISFILMVALRLVKSTDNLGGITDATLAAELKEHYS